MEKDPFKIVENVLSDDQLNKSVQKVFANEIPWSFSHNTVNGKPSSDPYAFGWSHIVYKEGAPTSQLYSTCLSIFLRICQKTKTNVNTLLRMRLGLITRTSESICHEPHVDSSIPHKVMLFYFNTSDGDTVLYKTKKDTDNKFEEAFRIKPVRNTAVLFDGSTYHSSSTPTQVDRRIVLTINYA